MKTFIISIIQSMNKFFIFFVSFVSQTYNIFANIASWGAIIVLFKYSRTSSIIFLPICLLLINYFFFLKKRKKKIFIQFKLKNICCLSFYLMYQLAHIKNLYILHELIFWGIIKHWILLLLPRWPQCLSLF